MTYKKILLLCLLPLVLGATDTKQAALYSKGLKALEAHEYGLAKETFLILLREPSLAATVIEEAHLGIIQADIRLGNYPLARARIHELLKKPLMPFVGFKTHILLATLEFEEHHIDEAARILKEQEAVCPLKDWPLEYRLLYVTIELLRGDKPCS